VTTILLLIIIGLLGYLIYKFRTGPAYDEPYYHPQSAKETLEELRAREILERDYVFITPAYGMHKGQKIPIREITRSMKEDPEFLSPQALGKWERKNDSKPQ